MVVVSPQQFEALRQAQKREAVTGHVRALKLAEVDALSPQALAKMVEAALTQGDALKIFETRSLVRLTVLRVLLGEDWDTHLGFSTSVAKAPGEGDQILEVIFQGLAAGAA